MKHTIAYLVAAGVAESAAALAASAGDLEGQVLACHSPGSGTLSVVGVEGAEASVTVG